MGFDAVDTWQQTALHLATQADSPGVFIRLINLGAIYRLKERYGLSPIHRALWKPHFAASINAMQLDLSHIVNDPSYEYSVLSEDCMKPWHRILRSFRPECRAKVVHVETRHHLPPPPLCTAAKECDLHNLLILLDASADIELQARTGTAYLLQHA